MSGADNTSFTLRKSAVSTTLTAQDYILLVLGATGAVTVTVPDASTVQPGRKYEVAKDAAAQTITIAPATGTIDGGANITLASGAKHGVEIIGDGTNWFTTDSF